MKRGALLLLLAFSGCAVGPDYQRPSVEVPAGYKEAGEWKVAQPRDDASPSQWWEMFGDPDLNALMEQVEISNQNVLAAEAQFRRAQAIVAASRAAYFPTVTANASIARSRSPTGVVGGTSAGRIITNRSASLDAGWELDLWGRVRRGAESSEASAQASAADLAGARLSSQAALASSYLLLRTIDAQKRILDESVAAFQRSYDLTKNRYEAGVAAKVDVVQAETQLKSTLADSIDLGVQRAQLEHAIAVLAGKAPGAFTIAPRPPDVARAPLSIRMPPIPTEVPSALLERRPDIASAERLVASANAQIGVAKAAYFPSLTLSGSYGSRAGDAASWFTAPSTFWAYGPALAQSIFDAGLRRAQTDQAIAAYDATVAQYRQTVLAGFQEVEDNLAALRILDEEAKVQEEAVRAARESVTLTTNQYKAGIVSYINVVAVQTAWLNNERAAMVVLGRRLVAAVTLLKALGGDWSTADLPEGEALRERTMPASAAR
ncbi:MAG TPA: efflux transporter outer membrane subunit [Burkholderiales bacterium]|nr:efflux transporter outer membrane subunit [Burkholderiales bacterium]